MSGRRHRRIALVTQGMNAGGGVATVSRWLYQALTAAGEYRIDLHTLATSSRDPSSRRLAAPGSWRRASLTTAGGEQSARHWGANAVELEFMRYRPRRELISALRGYDLIQVVAGSPAWACAVAGAGIPVVLQVATRACWERASQLSGQPLPARAWRHAMTRLTGRAERRALASVDAVLVENATMLDWVRPLAKGRVVKAAPGVDTAFFTPPERPWRPDGHLLSVCRLGDTRKGLDRTVLAYAEMVRRDDAVPELLLVGRGELPREVRALVTDLGLGGRIRVRSDVGLDELVTLYQGASVFLQTSHEEGLGMTVLEAMACGLPVVCTETAGSIETVSDGRTGWLVPQLPADRVPVAVAERTLRVLSDPDRGFGVRARERCLAHFSSDVALGRFTAVYDDLLGASRERGHSGSARLASGDDPVSAPGRLRADGLRTDQPIRERLPRERSLRRGRLAPPGVREGQNAQP
jgi:glycosyltransferase involved in cell wall biosynthesis